MKGFAGKKAICYDLPTMKPKFWLTIVTCLAWCIDRELYKAIDYLREQVRVLVELQEKQNKQIRLNNQPTNAGGGQGQTAQPSPVGAMYRTLYPRHGYALVPRPDCPEV